VNFTRRFLGISHQNRRQQKKIHIFDDLFGSELSQFKKYHPSENMKLIHLGISQS